MLPDKYKYRSVIAVVSLIVLALGIAVVVGWILNVALLKSILPGYATMKFNTALCFLLIGTSLLLHVLNNNKVWHQLSTLLFLTTLICGILSLSQGIFNYNLGIDQLFVTDFKSIESNQPYPGRMSPLTAICFILIGFAFGGIRFRNQKLRILAQIFLHAITILSFIAILGYLFNVSEFYNLSFLTSMAVHTAIAFFILSIAASLLNPELVITGLFTGNKIGNTIARKLFPQMLATILILTYMRLLSHRYAVVSVEFGIALFGVSFILMSMFLIWRAANELNIIETKKTKAEDMLSDIKVFLDSTPDPIVIVNEKGIIQLINIQTENVLGFLKEELIGQRIEVLMPTRFRKNHEGYRDKFFHSPKVRNMGTGQELFALKKDGNEIPVEISLSPIKMQYGTWVSAALRDMTKNKELEERLRKSSILEAKSKEMEQFTYIASHDLRHPLLTILNCIKIFDEEYADKLDDEAKYCLNSISSAAHRMDKLILGLLDYSRLSKIKELETVNCNEVIHSVIADLNSTIKSINAKITVEDLPTITAYPIELRQLFQNLITNALKFRKSDTSPELIISVKKEKEGYCFEFRDNGIGIETKDIEKLFLIFQRLHTEEEYEGTGLGLAYCKKIVELHRGQIWVESKPNEGSSFYFTIKT